MSLENPENEFELQVTVICSDLGYKDPNRIPKEIVIEWVNKYASDFRKALTTTQDLCFGQERAQKIIQIIHDPNILGNHSKLKT